MKQLFGDGLDRLEMETENLWVGLTDATNTDNIIHFLFISDETNIFTNILLWKICNE